MRIVQNKWIKKWSYIFFKILSRSRVRCGLFSKVYTIGILNFKSRNSVGIRSSVFFINLVFVLEKTLRHIIFIIDAFVSLFLKTRRSWDGEHRNTLLKCEGTLQLTWCYSINFWLVSVGRLDLEFGVYFWQNEFCFLELRTLQALSIESGRRLLRSFRLHHKFSFLCLELFILIFRNIGWHNSYSGVFSRFWRESCWHIIV